MLHDAFNKIYLINLPDRTDRLKDSLTSLSAIGIQRTDPKLTVFCAIRPVHSAGFRTPGAHGCFRSNLGALDDAVERRHSRMLLLEDDVMFERALSNRWPRI